MTVVRYTFTYASEVSSESDFMRDLGRVVQAGEFDERLEQAFLVALSEAFTNALLHGNQADPARSITVDIRVTDSVVAADISDEGKGGLERLRGRRPTAPLADHGRGLALIRHYTDNLTFDETEAGGLKVSMRFDRKPEKITS